MSSPLRMELKVIANVPFGQPAGAAQSSRFYALTLESPAWKGWTPGQFVMLHPSGGCDGRPLARPYSICRVTSRGLVLFIDSAEMGGGLSRVKSGDRVIAWGPLGNGFEMPLKKKVLLLAYGAGIAPFAGYADSHPDPSRLFLLFGHDLPAGCYPADAMASRLEMEDMPDTDADERLRFYEAVKHRMQRCGSAGGICLACGPMPFLRKVWRISLDMRVPTQLSLEHTMVCGTGACLGCAAVSAAKKEGMRPELPLQACKHGPVFWADDIDLDAGNGRRSE
ncbi:MAG: dihydroorotate dehydrogenase electron transfer subunit [Mailhella sp.]|nr:dihydroorotate dehydrogenase electron transfer subunit [Mailhella sp.]